MGPLDPVIRFAKDVWTNHKIGLAVFVAVIVVLGALSLAFGTP